MQTKDDFHDFLSVILSHLNAAEIDAATKKVEAALADLEGVPAGPTYPKWVDVPDGKRSLAQDAKHEAELTGKPLPRERAPPPAEKK
jgi:hypothetical protein